MTPKTPYTKSSIRAYLGAEGYRDYLALRRHGVDRLPAVIQVRRQQLRPGQCERVTDWRDKTVVCGVEDDEADSRTLDGDTDEARGDR